MAPTTNSSDATRKPRGNAAKRHDRQDASACQCQLIKEFRFETCGHTELQRGGPQPYCLLNGCCAEVGDVRKLLYLVGPGPQSNRDAVGECLQCHAKRVYLVTHPDADLRNETRRAMKQSRLLQEQKACEALIAISEAKIKHPSKVRRGHIVDQVEKAMRYLILQKYLPIGGPLQHDPDILYRLAAEVYDIFQRLGPEADRLMSTFGQVVTAYHEEWASQLYNYVRACDVRLSSVYIEAFTAQKQQNEALRAAHKQRNKQLREAYLWDQHELEEFQREREAEILLRGSHEGCVTARQEEQPSQNKKTENARRRERRRLRRGPRSQGTRTQDKEVAPEASKGEPGREMEAPRAPESFTGAIFPGPDSLGGKKIISWADDCDEFDA
ncbi:hypothetical protein PG989_015290 [Apiospora arundinis]